MSEHFFTFVGQAMPGGDRLVPVAGVMAGDKVIEIVSVAGPVIGIFTNNFAPYAPQGNTLVQDSSDLSAYTFLVRVQRADLA